MAGVSPLSWTGVGILQGPSSCPEGAGESEPDTTSNSHPLCWVLSSGWMLSTSRLSSFSLISRHPVILVSCRQCLRSTPGVLFEELEPGPLNQSPHLAFAAGKHVCSRSIFTIQEILQGIRGPCGTFEVPQTIFSFLLSSVFCYIILIDVFCLMYYIRRA